MKDGSEVRAKAPICTAFASQMREVFGEVKLQRLKEGDFEMGKPDQNVYASCIYGAGGKPLSELRKT